ncbi:MAG: hypothetical protein AVDCRST_MAG05-2749 [uncultured Rubrobacteraceae bacterium]|uniref:Uncharacterized protein n=1 Tax=uncultured Rubrobacteraceae bacterium TaxID=349277 RepID=A0A6J4SVI1_9ACTN|nr:MAG: hypothetical protein AVDCRST_MAG05-2749 [uncultured Rubrobacteraceae bacterium]
MRASPFHAGPSALGPSIPCVQARLRMGGAREQGEERGEEERGPADLFSEIHLGAPPFVRVMPPVYR